MDEKSYEEYRAIEMSIQVKAEIAGFKPEACRALISLR